MKRVARDVGESNQETLSMGALRVLIWIVLHPLRSFRAAIARMQNYLFAYWAIPASRGPDVSKAVLKRWLPKRPVVVDCGAYDGADSLDLARVLDATVYAFEPVPELHERLVAKTARDPRVRPFNVALGDRDGVFRLHVSGGASVASSSLFPPKEHLTNYPNVSFTKTLDVPTRTLQEWARERGVPRIDLLWLDVQGYELRLLQGAGTLLDTVSVIHTEVNLCETYEGTVLYGDLKNWLEKKGFRVVMEQIPEGWVQGNVVFARS